MVLTVRLEAVRKVVAVVVGAVLAVLLVACGDDTDAAVARGEDGERAVRRAVIDVVPDLLAAAGVEADDDTALRGTYRACGAEEGRVQYVAEQTFGPLATDPLERLAAVLTAADWSTGGVHADILTAQTGTGSDGVRAAMSMVDDRLRLRVEASCADVGDDAARDLVRRPGGFVPL